MSLEHELRAAIRIVENFPKPGISFKDVSPVFLSPRLMRDCVLAWTRKFADAGVTKVVGVESRGFLLGPALAMELNAGFVLIRKKGKLPGPNLQIAYELEYGSAELEIPLDVLKKEDAVLLHDDLLATGGTAAAAADLCMRSGARIAGFAFIVHLTELGGAQKLSPFSPHLHALIEYPS
ncbi:MAG: adenine phosphoribosyltransferase [Bacteroidia bacterium]|nr:adenine phosphoribosyltransferase [Bacteroidia bacterium]MDW8333785.1 adenine phosphoribosyltransferase [Bacteroidia bacterium]